MAAAPLLQEPLYLLAPSTLPGVPSQRRGEDLKPAMD